MNDEISMEELQELHFTVLNALYGAFERWIGENYTRLDRVGEEHAQEVLMSLDDARDGQFDAITLRDFRTALTVMSTTPMMGVDHLNNT